MKKCLFFAAAAAAVLATGCAKDAANGPAEVNEAGAIEFRTTIDKGDASRADMVSNAELNSFFVHAYVTGETALGFMNCAAYKEGSVWTYAPKKYFPSNGDAVNFFAYAPIKDVNMTTQPVLTTGSPDVVTFNYTLPAAQNAANTAADLMVSSVSADNTANANSVAGQVELGFFHALSAVTFSAANTNDAGSELTYVVSDVKIMQLPTAATYTYSFGTVGSWAPVKTPANTALANFSAGIPEAGVALVARKAGDVSAAVRKSLLTANDVMMIFPQTTTQLDNLATGANILAYAADPVANATVLDGKTYVEITYSLKDGAGTYIVENAKRNLPLASGFKFEANTRYNFAFDFSTTMAGAEALVNISFSVNPSAWTTPTATELVDPA